MDKGGGYSIHGFDEEILPLLASKGLEEVSLTIYTYDDFAHLIAELRARPYPYMQRHNDYCACRPIRCPLREPMK